MKPRRARGGHVLALAVLVLLALSIGSAGLSTRWTVDLAARGPGQDRAQALWLARSALDAGLRGTVQVRTPRGPARVEVSVAGGRRVAVAQLGGLVATVRTDPWEERLDGG